MTERTAEDIAHTIIFDVYPQVTKETYDEYHTILVERILKGEIYGNSSTGVGSFGNR